MMNDRELLELAANAAGINGCYFDNDDWYGTGIVFTDEDDCNCTWNPLISDGDALRLAVKLKLDINYGFAATQINVDSYSWETETSGVEVTEDGRDDPYAATRRAIVRAAAEIGKEMKK